MDPIALVIVELDTDRFTIVPHDEFHADHTPDDDELEDGEESGESEWSYMPGTEDGIEDHLPSAVAALMRIDEGMMGPDQTWWSTADLPAVRSALETAGHPVTTATW